MLRVLIAAVLVAAAAADTKSYEGYQVLRTAPLSAPHFDLLSALMKHSTDFDFWREPAMGQPCDIMAPPAMVDALKAMLNKMEVEFDVLHHNVEDKLSPFRDAISRKVASASIGRVGWEDYNTLDEIYVWLDELAAAFDYVEIVDLERDTYEGRKQRVLVTNRAGAGAPTVWIEAGIHAREWISPATATYIIDQLLNGEGDSFLDVINFHILVVTNPDGYSYTWTDDRLWRKNRHDTGQLCLGVDLNRNFDWHWAEVGVSGSPCGDAWPGTSAFSEVESQNVRDYVLSISPTPTLGNAIHSYAEQWLVPYGWDYDAYAPNYEEMFDLATDANNALNGLNGENYVVIHSADLYPAAGDANDWYTGAVEMRFAYTLELTGGDNNDGFELRPSEILPTVQEVWAAYREVLLPTVAELGKQQKQN